MRIGGAALSSHLLLVAILVGAAVLRVWGIGFGLPSVYHPDEPIQVEPAVRFGTGDLNPHNFHYGSLYPYLLFGFYAAFYIVGRVVGLFQSPSDVGVQYFVDPSPFYLIGRVVSAAFGTATVLLMYLIGKRLYGRNVGLVSAFLLAISPLHAEQSHYALTDALMTFLVTVSYYFSARILEEGSLRHYVWAGLFSGLAASTKYNGAYGLFALLLAHVIRMGIRWHGLEHFWSLHKRAFLAVVICVAAFVGGSPYVLLDYQTSAKHLASHAELTRIEGFGEEGRVTWLAVWTSFLKDGLGVGVEVLAVGGLLSFLVFRGKRQAFLGLGFLVFYLMLAQSKLNFARYWLPVFPLLVITAAWFLVTISHRLPIRTAMRPAALAGAAALIGLPSAVAAVHYDLLMTREDTRTVAKRWIEETVPQGTRVAVEAYGPQLRQDKESLLMALGTSEGSEESPGNRSPDIPQLADSRTPGKHMLEATRRIARYEKLYFVYNTWSLGEHSLQYYREKRFHYVVVTSQLYEKFLKAARRFPEAAAFYQALFSEAELVKEITPESVGGQGPTIRIFSLASRTKDGVGRPQGGSL